MKNIDKLKKQKQIYKITLIILWILLYLEFAFLIAYNSPTTTTILIGIILATIIALTIIHKINKNLKAKINTMDTITKSIEDSK